MVQKLENKTMSYLRVVMVDAKTSENRDNVLNRINTKASSIFPEIQMMMAIATGETTALSISVYEDKAAASRAIVQREADKNETGWELEVAFEGPFAAYYKKNPVKSEKI